MAEKESICMLGADIPAYNRAFTMPELEPVIATPKRSSPGPNGIHYEMPRKLSRKSHEALLAFYNSL